MINNDARHRTWDCDLQVIVRAVVVFIAAVAVCGVNASNAIGINQRQVCAAVQLNLDRVSVSIECGDGYDTIAVDVVDVKLNVFNFFREGPFERTATIGAVVDRLKAADRIDCFGAAVDAINVQNFAVQRAFVVTGICGAIIGNRDRTGVLRKSAINLGVGCAFPVEAFADSCDSAVDIITIDGVVFAAAIDRIVTVIADNRVSTINTSVGARNITNQRDVIDQRTVAVVVARRFAQGQGVRPAAGDFKLKRLPFVAWLDDTNQCSAKVNLDLIVGSFDALFRVYGQGIGRTVNSRDILRNLVDLATAV